MAREVLDIFMLCVDDLRQFLPINHFFINPHADHGVEAVGGFDIVPDYFGNGRTPERDRIEYFIAEYCLFTLKEPFIETEAFSKD